MSLDIFKAAQENQINSILLQLLSSTETKLPTKRAINTIAKQLNVAPLEKEKSVEELVLSQLEIFTSEVKDLFTILRNKIADKSLEDRVEFFTEQFYELCFKYPTLCHVLSRNNLYNKASFISFSADLNIQLYIQLKTILFSRYRDTISSVFTQILVNFLNGILLNISQQSDNIEKLKNEYKTQCELIKKIYAL